jgi:hypothetical protein
MAGYGVSAHQAPTLPFGPQLGRAAKVGGMLPVNFAVGAYYNAIRPEFGSTWRLRSQITFVF